VTLDSVPSASELAFCAEAPLPAARLEVPAETAAGPMAMLSVPVARLSASVELAWKYLMPAPLLMLSMAVLLAVTCWFVA